MTRPLRVGNASGFYGDRFAAVREMLDGGELDVLTGDYLAELTMLILGRDRAKDPALGYAKTFLRQMEESLGLAVERGVKIVTNAGGLNPAGLARRLRELAKSLGIDAEVAHVEGDDLLPRADELGLGSRSPPTPTSAPGGSSPASTAAPTSSSPGGSPTPRSSSVRRRPTSAGRRPTTTPSPAPPWPATSSSAAPRRPAATTRSSPRSATSAAPGFPIAEIHADGSSVITKHAGTGGAVTIETVTAQLLYEIGGPRYAGPDVTTRFDTIELTADGPTGCASAACAASRRRRRQGRPGHARRLPQRGRLRPHRPRHRGQGGARPGAARRVRRRRGRSPAPTTPTPPPSRRPAPCCTAWCVAPTRRRSAGRSAGGHRAGAGVVPRLPRHRPARRRRALRRVHRRPRRHRRRRPRRRARRRHRAAASTRPETASSPTSPSRRCPSRSGGRPAACPLGTVAGARSGDKGGDANVGVWARTDDAWRWLANALTVDELRHLLPETEPLPVTRHVLPNLRALNFVIEGCSARASPRRPASIRRPRRSASGCARATSTSPRRCLTETPMTGRVPRTDLDTAAEFAANREAMLAKLAEIDAEHAKAIAGGGPKYTERHHQRGKLLARERIELLLDEDAPFLELSPLAAYGTDYTVGASVVTGIGVVSGVECLISANDPTVRGGASNPCTLRKAFRAADIAFENRLPTINLVESGGADLPTQKEIFIPGGRTFRDLTRAVGARHPDDRPRLRQLDGGRRRLPARACPTTS